MFQAEGYPINFWQVNPFSAGRNVNYLGASGSSNYHGLQIEFRQRSVHGAQFNVNYTWSHSLGIVSQNGIRGQNPLIYYTNRNFRLNYGPSLFDIRHVLHASGTYDLPFGRGKAFLSNSGWLDRIVGGWTLGTILVLQSGTPTELVGGYATLNANAGSISESIIGDSGIYFNGATAAQVQNGAGVYKSGNPWVTVVAAKDRKQWSGRERSRSCQHAGCPGILALYLRTALVQRRLFSEQSGANSGEH
jgi:hypothetical protein